MRDISLVSVIVVCECVHFLPSSFSMGNKAARIRWVTDEFNAIIKAKEGNKVPRREYVYREGDKELLFLVPITACLSSAPSLFPSLLFLLAFLSSIPAFHFLPSLLLRT